MKRVFKSSFLALILMLCLCTCFACQNKEHSNISIEVIYQQEQIYFKDEIVSKAKSVYELMTELEESDEEFTFQSSNSQYGQYIVSICGIDEKTENGVMYYWSFYVNESYSSLGISSQKLSDGMKIKFVYESYELN